MIAKVALYLAVFASVIGLHKNEVVAALVLLALLGVAVALMPPKDRMWMTTAAVIVGALITVADFIGIKYAKAWQYNHTAYVFPLWLPLGWVMIALFSFDAFSYIQRVF